MSRTERRQPITDKPLRVVLCRPSYPGLTKNFGERGGVERQFTEQGDTAFISIGGGTYGCDLLAYAGTFGLSLGRLYEFQTNKRLSFMHFDSEASS